MLNSTEVDEGAVIVGQSPGGTRKAHLGKAGRAALASWQYTKVLELLKYFAPHLRSTLCSFFDGIRSTPTVHLTEPVTKPAATDYTRLGLRQLHLWFVQAFNPTKTSSAHQPLKSSVSCIPPTESRSHFPSLAQDLCES